jgi:hypothetical protein
MTMTWHEIGLAAAQAEAPSITLDGLVAQKLGANPRTRYSQDFAAARSAFPEGWGFWLDCPPGGRAPYCEGIGTQRVGSTGQYEIGAMLAAACMAQSYVENRRQREEREIAARRARQPQPVAEPQDQGAPA